MKSVAVVIPVFNRPLLLLRAVESVLGQRVRATELIVVDDGSVDDLEPVRQRVLESGFRWIRLNENRGVAEARNVGVANTGSEWIAFLDSDDEWEPDKLERQMAWHELNPIVRISQTREQWVRDGRSVVKPQHWEPVDGDLSRDSRRRCMIGPSCVMMRRDLWEEFGGFDPRFRVCEDFDLWLRITRSTRVGLVGGAPLVKKHGGHSDQLSLTTEALDRYRVLSLLGLLITGDLSTEEGEDIVAVIREKSGIVAGGAAKRGELERETFFRSLQGAELRGDGGELVRLLSEGWRTVS